MPNRTVAVELKALVSNYVAGMKQAAQATSDLADKAGKKLEQHSDKVSQLGTGMALTGAWMLLVAGKAVKTFADFDKAMSGVAATGDDAKASLGGLRAMAIQLGADTQFSATEAAEGITNLLKAGLSAKDVIGGGLAGSLNLAAAGQMAVADAAEVTAITLAQFNLQGSQASHVADLLAAGAGKASGDVSDMAMALKQVGLVANQTGLSVEETTGTLAMFAKAGLMGSDAGTSMKTMLQRLTPQSAEAQKQFDKLGISAYDSSGKFVGLANFAGQLHDKLNQLTPKARNAALTVMFGSDAIRAATELYKNGAEGVQEWTAAVNDQGYAQRQAAELTNNLAGDLERLGGSLDSAFIKSGSGANTVLRSLTQGAEAAVDAIGDMPAPLLSVVTMLTGAGGLATLGVGGLLKLAGAAADAKENFKALGISAKTTKLAVAGIGGALAVGTLALSAWASNQAAAAEAARTYASTMVVVDGQVARTGATVKAMNDQLATAKTNWLDTWLNMGPSIADQAQKVGMSFDDMNGYLSGTTEGTQAYLDKVVQLRDQNPALTGDLHTLTTALDGQKASLSAAEQTALAQARANEQSAKSSGNLSDALQAQRSGAEGAADAIQQVTTAIYGMQDANLSLASNEVAFEQAIDDSAAAVKKLLKATKDKADLQNIDTQAGRDALTVLTSLAGKTNDLVKTQIKQGKSEADINATMTRGRKAFADRARDLGFSEQKIADLIAQYLQVPDNVTTEVDETGAENAKTRVTNLLNAVKKLPKSQQTKVLSEFNNKGIKAAEAALNKINGKTVTTTVRTVYKTKAGTKYEADGGLLSRGLGGFVQQFAGGGTWGQPQVRPFQGAAGVNWGEAGSGPWEAFISGAPQKRDRSIAIWREVGRRLLGDFSAADVVAGFASGGIIEPTYQGKPISYWQTQLKTPLELTQLQIQIRDLKAELAAKVGKGRKRRDRLRGLERTEAQQRLAEAEDEYRLALLAKQANESQQGTLEAQTAAWEAQKGAADAASRWQQQYMTGSSAADLLANMQAGAGQISAFNDLLGQLDAAGLSDQLMSWLWDQGPGASDMAKQILGGGQSLIDAFNQTSGNLSKAADAAGQSEATGAWVRSPVLSNVNLPGYMTSGANGAVVSNKTINFNVTQTDPYTAVVYFDQQLRYL